jgi:hypothetical protein
MTVRDAIREKLSKKELHKLFSLCRKYYPLPLRVLEGQEEFIAKHKKDALGPGCYEKLLEIRKIHTLYQKAGATEGDYLAHWTVERSIQAVKHKEYTKTSAPERKDNKTYINKGNGGSHPSKIRYPRKVRKTAWKRFYKLFPTLNPERDRILTKN